MQSFQRNAYRMWFLFWLPLFSQGAPDWQVPLTSYGHPDLQGIWTSASVTTLERDKALGKTLIVDAEEARQLERQSALNVLTEADSGPSDPDRPPPADGDTDAGYNAFWIDPGTRLAEINGGFRTSFIVDPDDGQIPYSAAAGIAFFNMDKTLVTMVRNKDPLVSDVWSDLGRAVDRLCCPFCITIITKLFKMRITY